MLRALKLSMVIGLLLLMPVMNGAPMMNGTAHAADEKNGLPEITVYKSPTCGCCAKWATHLRDNGFSVKEINARSMAEMKQHAGITPKLRSCHTAFLTSSDAKGAEKTYAIEGHVPAEDIKQLLRKMPDIKGLSVPGMPIGSPGMEAADGRREKYDVLSFDDEGNSAVFNSH